MVDATVSQDDAARPRRNIFAASKGDPVICEGSLVIIYLSRDNLVPVVITKDETSNTRYGRYKHADLIGQLYGAKVIASNGDGFCHVLRPTPELWSMALSHRTQILYMPDIAYVTLQLDIKPGSRVIEAGTGSGSFSHAVARSIGSSGKLYSFEFHEQRCEQARQEFGEHGLLELIQLEHRNVCRDGFGVARDVDAVFLDLPAPWEAVEAAKSCMRRDRLARICCFSPCIEQVTRTVTTLRDSGFTDITMYETLTRQHDSMVCNLPTVEDAISRLKNIELRKAHRREQQLEDARQLRLSKRKAEEMEEAPSDQPSASESRRSTPAKPDEEEVMNSENGRQEDEVIDATAPNVDRTTLSSNGPPTPVANGVKASTAANAEHRQIVTRPAIQIRGHTSYLTFASLLPLNPVPLVA